ncbi:transcription factor 19 [Tachyglossus aculeatus]|uniref:transcription factor 19 n=1 Tax=Tachyglossus aculeatus TaxID=9261 RepID=UPI0018F5C4E3|nr:transcription factor 19 [Tachyglossus aculeatus]
MLPCFQLLRMGGGGGGDLYTFRPAGTGCTYRLGRRADLCDVPLRPEREPGLVSRVHAELHAERDAQRDGDWRVSLLDCSSHGTSVNNVRLPRGRRVELDDGDLLTFGSEGGPGTEPPEFCFMFQRVRVRPQDFAAITVPRATGVGGGFRPMLPSRGAPQRPLSAPSPSPKATLILSSIGSLSKLRPQPLTFSRGGGPVEAPAPAPAVGGQGAPDIPPAPRNRRKSAHRVLAELEDEGVPGESPPAARPGPRKKPRMEKTPVTPSGKRRGRPRKYPIAPVPGGDPCAAPRCRLPQDETVTWVQCDHCDAWFHVACAGCSYRAAQEADFRCPTCRA